jgi:hypothetical protein
MKLLINSELVISHENIIWLMSFIQTSMDILFYVKMRDIIC